MKLLKLVILL